MPELGIGEVERTVWIVEELLKPLEIRTAHRIPAPIFEEPPEHLRPRRQLESLETCELDEAPKPTLSQAVTALPIALGFGPDAKLCWQVQLVSAKKPLVDSEFLLHYSAEESRAWLSNVCT